ncbi:MAG: aldose 1-epimerase family protein [Verrucomicrobiota bacterium]|nr:aldose 1-epimerase family protein [Verrucomicrobiota bacterium]
MKRIITVGLLTVAAASHAELHYQVLTSNKRDINTESWQLTSSDFPSYKGKVRWSVNKRTLSGGKQEGVELIEVNNGRLQFRVIPTRGMSVLDVTMGDVRLGWNSPVKEVVHPSYINLHDRGGLGWLDGFNEWMVRCGLSFAGHPGEDKFINNVGAESTMDLTLHGKIGNIPASEVVVVVEKKAPHRIRIRGLVNEVSFYGPNLTIWTEISTVPNSSEFQISDELINNGTFDEEFQIIYHANFGRPLLGKGAKMLTASTKIVPFNDNAAKAIDKQEVYPGPVKGFTEEVYKIYPKADKFGKAWAMLTSPKGDRGVTISWPVKQLPYLTQWKNTAAETTGYVTGIEPGTGFPHNRSYERKYGRVPKLAPGKTRSFDLEFKVLGNKEDVKTASEVIKKLQGTVGPEIQKQPEE